MSKGLIVLAVLNLIGVLGGGALTFMALSEPLIEPTSKDAKDMLISEYLHHQKIFGEKPIIFSFDPLTVNLSDATEERVVQLELNLEMMDEKSFEEVVTRQAAVRDAVVKILAQKKYEELNTVQGKLFLKDDISMAVNQQLSRGLIKGVYFTSFFMP